MLRRTGWSMRESGVAGNERSLRENSGIVHRCCVLVQHMVGEEIWGQVGSQGARMCGTRWVRCLLFVHLQRMGCVSRMTFYDSLQQPLRGVPSSNLSNLLPHTLLTLILLQQTSKRIIRLLPAHLA